MDKLTPQRDYKLTSTTIRKLEQAFSMDSTVNEACFCEGIGRGKFTFWVFLL